MDRAVLSSLFELLFPELVFQYLFADFFQVVGAHSQYDIVSKMTVTAVGTTTQASMFQFVDVGFYG